MCCCGKSVRRSVWRVVVDGQYRGNVWAASEVEALRQARRFYRGTRITVEKQ